MATARNAGWRSRLLRGLRARRGAAAVEFALVSIPFFVLLLGTFEESFDLFQQEVLDSAVHLAARDLEVGGSTAQNFPNSTVFINNEICPYMSGLLTCSTSNVFVRIVKVATPSTSDFYDAVATATGVSNGPLPLNANGSLNTSDFGTSKFCNIGPAQLMLISVLYTGPTVVGLLLPNTFSVSYNGQQVRATMSSVAVATEAWTPAAAAGSPAPAC